MNYACNGTFFALPFNFLLLDCYFVALAFQLTGLSLLRSCLLLASFTLKNPDLKQETSKKQARNKQGSECF